jgi:hypothetical protein
VVNVKMQGRKNDRISGRMLRNVEMIAKKPVRVVKMHDKMHDKIDGRIVGHKVWIGKEVVGKVAPIKTETSLEDVGDNLPAIRVQKRAQ